MPLLSHSSVFLRALNAAMDQADRGRASRGYLELARVLRAEQDGLEAQYGAGHPFISSYARFRLRLLAHYARVYHLLD